MISQAKDLVDLSDQNPSKVDVCVTVKVYSVKVGLYTSNVGVR
jgi:hypothetical protein